MAEYGSFRPAVSTAFEEVWRPKPRKVQLALNNLSLISDAPSRVPSRHKFSSPPVSIQYSPASCCTLPSAAAGGLECEAGREILDIVLTKVANGSAESPSYGFSPPCFTGSPPSRAGNPLVRDTQFTHHYNQTHNVHHQQVNRTAVPSPAAATTAVAVAATPATHTKVSSKGLSFHPAPVVRVEGFDCSASRGFNSCTGHDHARRHVPAFA